MDEKKKALFSRLSGPTANLDAFLCGESNFDSSVVQPVPYHLYQLRSLVLVKGATALLGMGQKK
jgi:hypothetical protein